MQSLKHLPIAWILGLFAAAAPAAEAPTAEDIAVLRAALAPDCERPGPGYVLLSTEIADINSDDQVPADWAEAADLTARLHARAGLSGSWSGVRVCGKILVRRERDIHRLINSDPSLDQGWKNFYAVYPGALGVMRVSLPAYSADGHRAVIVMGTGCGSLCGAGEIVEIEKKDGVWRRTRAQDTWIS
jgi:hypothetical protein